MNRGGERGAALVVALWSAVILALIAAGLVRLSRDDLALARNLNDAIKAELAADSGVSVAIHALSGPAPWPTDGSVQSLFLEGAEIRIEVIDEGRRLDLNNADEASLAAILRLAGEPAETARRLATAIVARRGGEGDDAGDDGEERPPAFMLVRDLLELPGFTPALFSRIEDEVTVYGGARGLAESEGEDAAPTRPANPAASAGDAEEDEGPPEGGRERLFRIRSEAMTEAGAVAVRIGVYALRASPPLLETRLWTRGERRLFPAPAY